MKKLSDCDKDERSKIEDEINISSNLLGGNYDDAPFEKSVEDFGLCTNCESLKYAITQYDKVYAKCDIWEKHLHSADNIIKCSHYNKRGQMDLYTMQGIAVLIDPPARKIGF